MAVMSLSMNSSVVARWTRALLKAVMSFSWWSRVRVSAGVAGGGAGEAQLAEVNAAMRSDMLRMHPM
jgi:hypothetical protein